MIRFKVALSQYAVSNSVLIGAAAAILCGLSACDNGPSAVSTRERGAETTVATYPPAPERDGGAFGRHDRSGRRDAERGGDEGGQDVAWASSRKYSAHESAQYHFQRDGADFGAGDVDAYVQKANTFVHKPPKGTLRLERSNGDQLFYDPKGNVFAVATKDGAPRTMFKPKDGMAYWDEQKAREAQRRDRAGADGERS